MVTESGIRRMRDPLTVYSFAMIPSCYAINHIAGWDRARRFIFRPAYRMWERRHVLLVYLPLYIFVYIATSSQKDFLTEFPNPRCLTRQPLDDYSCYEPGPYIARWSTSGGKQAIQNYSLLIIHCINKFFPWVWLVLCFLNNLLFLHFEPLCKLVVFRSPPISYHTVPIQHL